MQVQLAGPARRRARTANWTWCLFPILFPTGPAVEALPVDEKSPVVLRIAGQAESDGSTIYEIRYLGMQPGRYDLRRYLRRVDGRPLNDVEPIMVSVVSVLPANHNGQLDELARPPLPRAWPYRAAADPGGRPVARAAGLAAGPGGRPAEAPPRGATARPSRRWPTSFVRWSKRPSPDRWPRPDRPAWNCC